jgi:PAS domain S-box-containing protein
MDRPIPNKIIRDDKFLNALSDAYQLQEAMLNAVDLAIYSISTDGLIRTVNKSAEELLGYRAEELIGKSTPLIFHDVDELVRKANELSSKYNITIEPIADVFTATIKQTNTAYRGEWTMIRKDGTRFPANLSINALHDFRDEVIGYVAIASPLTKKDQGNLSPAQEEEFKKIAEENFRIFNNAVTLNVVAGFDGYFKRVSNSWTNILGWTHAELETKPFTSFIHPDDLKSTQEAIEFIKKGNNLSTFENRYRAKDGTYRWLLWSSAFDLEQRLIYASAIDITHRKKSEDELINSKQNIESIAVKLQEQNRQLDEFAHIISHNLRSPVGNIKALINLLDENSGLQDYKLIFFKLKNVAQNLSDTMNDLMETLKVKTQTELEKNEIRFKEVLDKVIQTLEGDLIIAEASVTFDFNAAPVIHYPKAYLESIFQNLLSNALKYRSSDRKAQIHFHSQEVNGHVQLRVTDNGQGIDLEKHGDKLFGLHRTFHHHEQARGVGLFLIKNQIESMGGSISADSVVGKGTTFTIKFID